jgi:aryl-alcohol dehydrogenase-like predicted oxidoreductase
VTLPKRSLGTTGMELTTVGFGAWAIAGPGWHYTWGDQDDRDSVAAIHRAVEAGVNWIDTAAVYGYGRSEEIVATALAALPAADRPLVFTKCGLVWDPDDRRAKPRQIMDPANVRRELEASLRRLDVDHLDLYQVHWPGEDVPLEEYWQVMVDLRTAGTVRAIGLSNHDVAQLEAAERIGHVDAIQPRFSAISREAAAEIAWSSEHGTGAIVYSPMQSGLLTGAFSAERVQALPPDDWRRGDPDFTTDLDRHLALADALAPVAQRHGVPVPAVAVAWTLAWPGLTGAIVGARRPEQVDDWIPAAGLTLTDDDLDEIAAAIERTGAGAGPARPPVRGR